VKIEALEEQIRRLIEEANAQMEAENRPNRQDLWKSTFDRKFAEHSSVLAGIEAED